jgi:RsiW-degrading membrane proteinase PrsW (M82 family)
MGATDTLWLFLLAAGPPIAIAGIIWWLDRYDREPHDLMIGSFLWGALVTVPVIIIELGLSELAPLDRSNLASAILSALGIIALTEESAKYLVARLYVYHRPDFDEPYDGITYCVVIGMGFAAVENVLYVLSEETGAWERALVRMVLAVPAHAVNGVLMGYFLGRAKFSATPKRYHAAALATAVSTHGLYDVFLLYDHAELLAGGALVVLAVAGWLSVRAIKQHVQSSPFRDAG